MFGKKFKFTETDLDKMITEALQEKSMGDGTATPNVLQRLKAQIGLNKGKPQEMGENLGIPKGHALKKIQELGDHCLLCDKFFLEHHTG